MGIPIPKRLKTDNPNQAKSRVQERATAKAFSAGIVRGSGAGRVKGDVQRKGILRVEAKTTKRPSFSVTRDLLDKLEAMVPVGSEELPFFEIKIDDESPNPKTCYVFPSWAGAMILDYFDAKAGEGEGA